MYRERSGRYLQLLSQARSLSDLLIRLNYANIAGQYNVEVTRTLRAEVQNLETQRTRQAQQTSSWSDIASVLRIRRMSCSPLRAAPFSFRMGLGLRPCQGSPYSMMLSWRPTSVPALRSGLATGKTFTS